MELACEFAALVLFGSFARRGTLDPVELDEYLGPAPGVALQATISLDITYVLASI